MKNIDMQLSEKVAEKASEQITELKHSLDNDKDAHISLLSDVVSDIKGQMKFMRHISICLFLIVFILIIGIIALGIYNQRTLKNLAKKNLDKFVDFIECTDFTTQSEIITDNDSENSGSITIGK